MVFWHLLRAARHQLVLVLIGLSMTTALCWVIQSRQGLYQASLSVVLLPPETGASRNPFIGRDYSLIATAGSVASTLSAGTSTAQTASPEVTLAAQGIKQGWIVRVPNAGGQWSYDYRTPTLDIQSVGPNAASALAGVTAAQLGIQRSLDELESRVGVDRKYKIVIAANPPQPTVVYSAGRPKRALGGMLLLGFGMTTAAVLWADDRQSTVSSTSRRSRQWFLRGQP